MAVAGSLTYSTKLDTSGYQKGINDIKGTTKSTMGEIKNIVAALGIDKVISSAMSTISSSVDSAMKRIDTMAQFTRVMTAMTGSTEQASQALENIKETVTGTAYGLDIAARSAQKFVTSGMSLEKATQQVKTWADAVAFYGDGTNETFENVTDALSQMVAKGKVEMDQLNRLTDAGIPALQIYADSVGRSVADVQEDLSDGVISAQEFMDGLSEAFNKGTSRFASITNAAKEAGASWTASFDNMKAAVTRGMVNVIEAIDEGLTRTGLPTMREMISDIGKEAEKLLSGVAKKIPSSLKNITNFLTKNQKAIMSVVTALIAFKSALLVQNSLKNMVNIVKSLNSALMANPYGIAIAGITALFTGLYTLANRTDEYLEKLQKQKEAVDEVRKSQEQMNKEAQKTVNQGMSELAYYENLYLQLQTLVDENGRVKDGYQERVSFIVGELSEGLGMEISLTDGVISNYKELSSQFDDVIAKKRAMITLNAHEEQYTEAIKNQSDAYSKLAEYSLNMEKTQRELNKLKNEYSRIKTDPLVDQDTIVDYEGRINKLRTYLNEQKDLYNKQSKVVEEYSTDIAVYEDNLAKFQAGKYDEMTQYSKNYLADLKFNSDDQLNTIADQVAKEKEILEYLKSLKKKYNTDIYDDQIASSEQRLNQLEQQFQKEKGTVESGNAQTLEAWLLGLSKTVSSITGKQYEFKDAGDGTVRMFIDGVEQKKKIAYNNVEDFANKLVNKLDKKQQAKNTGLSLLDGVNEGLSDKNKQQNAFNIITGFANNISKRFQDALEVNSPSRVFRDIAKFIPEGVAVGIEDNTDSALKAIQKMNDEMVSKMNNAVALETGNINAKAKISSTVANNSVIQIDASFTGDVEMDKTKVGRIVTPEITRTLKAGGLK